MAVGISILAKRSLRIAFRLPPYRAPRTAWRLAIHAAASQAAQTAGIKYGRDDRLELEVRLFFAGSALAWHDVDNRLKDVLDALQGRAGGAKSVRRLSAVIPNDSQVYRVTVVKGPPPKQSLGMGHAVVRRHRSKVEGA